MNLFILFLTFYTPVSLLFNQPHGIKTSHYTFDRDNFFNFSQPDIEFLEKIHTYLYKKKQLHRLKDQYTPTNTKIYYINTLNENNNYMNISNGGLVDDFNFNF